MTSPFKIGKRSSESKNKWASILESSLVSSSYPSRGKIYASNSSLCELQTAGLSLLGDEHESTRNAATQFYFAAGSAFERVLEKGFKSAGVFVDAETHVESGFPWLNIGGRIDFLITDPEPAEGEDKLTLVEAKTCGKLPDKPKIHHKAQLMTYLLLTGMNRGLIWYVSRSVAGWDGVVRQTVHEVKPTLEEKKWYATRLVVGATFAEAESLPRKPPHMKKYKCGFCPLIPMCWDGKEMPVDGKTPEPGKYKDLLKLSGERIDKLMGRQELLRERFLDTFDTKF